MALPLRHLKHQKKVIHSMGLAFLETLKPQALKTEALSTFPGPEVIEEVPPIDSQLIRDYLVEVGGDSSNYLGVVPPHLFPQWCFPAATKTMASLPYPLSKILNAGCKLEINGEVPLGETLKVRARIEDITEKSNKAFIHQIVTTSTRDQKNILVAHMYTVVILGKSSSKKTSKKLQVPEDARNLDQFRLKSNSGLKFALLTGDFNPVHWVKPVAMLSGFKSTILHGFASMARSFEVINNQLLGGNHRQLKSIEVKFTKPILLPGNVSFYLKKDEFFLAKNNDEKPNLVGSFELRSTNE